jgi:hypothetical protein
VQVRQSGREGAKVIRVTGHDHGRPVLGCGGDDEGIDGCVRSEASLAEQQAGSLGDGPVGCGHGQLGDDD